VLKALLVSLLLPLAVGPSGAPELPVASTFETFGQVHHASPTIADVNGDGVSDLVVADLKGRVYARTSWGDDLSGWPVEVRIGHDRVTAVESTPAVVDLDGDGLMEVVVGAGSRWVEHQDGGLLVFNADGSVRCRYQTMDLFDVWDDAAGATPDGFSEGVMSTPAIGDIDGDGKSDIVFGGWDNHVHAINRACKTIPGFPFHVDDSVWSSPALHDADGDGNQEIFVGSAASPGGPENWTGGVFRELDWSAFGGGYVVVKWRQRIGEVIDSSPAIGDIDGDGRVEAVVGTGVFYGRDADVDDAHRVFAWHVDDGSPLPGWPVEAASEVWGSPALGDVDGDGIDDVVFGARDGLVRAYRGDGTLAWRTQPNTRYEGGGEIISTPVIADLDGDGANDVALGNGWGTFFLRGSDGTRLYEPAGKGLAFQNSPVVGQLGDDWVVAIAGLNLDGTGVVSVLPIPAPGSTPPWPAWRRDAQHTGARVAASGAGAPAPAKPTTATCGPDRNPPAVPSSAAALGYWSTAENGRVVASNARHVGSMLFRPLNAPIIGLASTPTGRGYWQLGADGGIFAFGDAHFYGSTGGLPLRRPVTDIVATRSGHGYWLVASDGGVFTYGDAPFVGSTGDLRLQRPIVAMSPSPSGNGYFLFSDDGGVFTYGDAIYQGSPVGHVRGRIVDAAANPDGLGYWLLGDDGSVYAFGEARYLGGVPGKSLCRTAGGVSIVPTTTGLGYYVLGTDGRVFTFGDALHRGNATTLAARPTGLAIRQR
jgi:hypothetical protein